MAALWRSASHRPKRIREAREEIGADIRLTRLLDVLGGPHYEVTYPNGDRTAYVTAVYEAEIVDGIPVATELAMLAALAVASPSPGVGAVWEIGFAVLGPVLAAVIRGWS